MYLLLQSPIPSAVGAHATMISALLPQGVKPPLHPSSINPHPHPLPQILALPLQRDVPPLQRLDVHAAPPLTLSILFQGQGKHHVVSPTVRCYVTIISALLLRQGNTIHQPSDEPSPIPKLSA